MTMGHKIVITGASSGIGRITAGHLEEHGYEIIGVSRHRPMDVSFEYHTCDLSDPAAITACAEDIASRHDHVDGLVNCAGIGVSGALEYVTDREIDVIFDVNLKGTIQFTQAMIPLLRTAGHAKIINIGSVAGPLTIPFQTLYSMTKSALRSFSEGLRMELKPFGIDVCLLLPGDTKTPFTANRQKSDIGADTPYGNRVARSIAKMERDEQHGKDPVTVAKAIRRLLGKRTMPVTKTIGWEYRLFLFLNRVLPRSWVIRLLYRLYGK